MTFTRKFLSTVGVIATAVILNILSSTSTYAVSNIAPDAGDFTNVDGSHQVRILVSSGSLQATQSTIYIYAKNPNPTVTITGADHCYTNNGAINAGVDASHIIVPGTDTTFSFATRNNGAYSYNAAASFGNNTVLTSDGDVPNPYSACHSAQVTRGFTLTGADKMPASTGLGDYYQIRLIVDLVQPANATNSFMVGVDDGIVSYTSVSGNKFALMNRPPSTQASKSTFNLYFATPCDASPADLTNIEMKWFDADQNDYSQSPSDFYFNILSRPRGSGVPWSSAAVEVSNYSNLGGNNVDSSSLNGGNGYRFNFDRSKEYDWQWVGVSQFNGVQFQIPFDSAYAKVSCEGADFALTPKISINPLIVSPATNSIGVTAWVDKTGSTSSFSDEEWRVTRFIVSPGGNLFNNGGASEPCSQFGGYAAGRCNTVWSAGGQTFTNNSTTLTSNWGDGVDSTLQPGSKICYATSVSKGSTAAPTWLHSNVVCSLVLQIPFSYILGNDLRVGSGFSLSQNNLSDIYGYVTSKGGSWTEYGVLAPHDVSGMASQAGALDGSSSAQSSWSNLTFANTGASGCGSAYGCFASAASMGTIPNVKTFITNPLLTGVEKRDKGASNVSISSEFGGGIYNLNNFRASVVLYTTGTVTIDQDIKYTTSTLTDTSQLPQLIIIAGNINITSNVKQADAWLVSTGTVNTCSDVAQANIRTTNCNDSLRINGPIMANQLLLDRTYYDQSKVHAAEEVNLRGDAYVWANRLSRTNGSWQTTYTTDLPPRY